MQAKIYRPKKTSMQSGRAAGQHWVLELVGGDRRSSDPVMGWTSVEGTDGQVRLRFDSREAAIAYAKRENLVFSVDDPRPRKRLVKSYGENFDAGRKQPWTH